MQSQEAAKHGAAAGEAGRPERPDWTIDQDWEHYTAAEHAVWRTLFNRQTKLLPRRACDEFVQGMRALPIGADRIPDFRHLNEVLSKRTRWQVVAVPGLVPDEVFFEHLANRRFPAGQFIRKPEQLDYLEEPDVFHDVFGHVPMLMNPVIADYIQAYGIGGLRAQKLGVLQYLARVYWYTVEFGPGAAARRPAHLRLGHCVVVHRERVRARRCVAEPATLRARARDAHPLPDRRLPGDVFRARHAGGFARARADRFRADLRARAESARSPAGRRASG
jgi:hypothetical protein